MGTASVVSIDIETADGVSDARIAKPGREGRFPGVLFYVDAFGPRPTIDACISRIADQGYVVLAPNLLYRSSHAPLIDDFSAVSDPERRPMLFEKLRPMMKELTPESALRDARYYLETLMAQAETQAGKVGVVGYCMGGAHALRTAAAYPDKVGAAASFHGGNLATDAADSPHLMASSIAAEVYIGHADNDQSAPPEQQERLAKALECAGISFQAELYTNALHGFTMPDSAAYREEAAERHFVRLIDLFRRSLG